MNNYTEEIKIKEIGNKTIIKHIVRKNGARIAEKTTTIKAK